jgi:hypothetical protein
MDFGLQWQWRSATRVVYLDTLKGTTMAKLAGYVVIGLALAVMGCATPARNMKRVQLGMTPDQVRKEAGDPYTVRAAKAYEDGRTMEVWEYIARLAIYPKDYWVVFENGKVVQWGEPGDFSQLTASDPPVNEYNPVRKAN